MIFFKSRRALKHQLAEANVENRLLLSMTQCQEAEIKRLSARLTKLEKRDQRGRFVSLANA